MQVPKRKSEQSVKRETGPLMITADGLARLERQLPRLQKTLPELIAEVERTKAHGDFSENAGYQDAKAALRRTYSRIDSVKDRIKRAVIIAQGPNESGQVRIGSTVILETGGKRHTFEILGPHEADPKHGRISDQSPLGLALLDHAVGDEIVLKLTSAEVCYRIVEIR